MRCSEALAVPAAEYPHSTQKRRALTVQGHGQYLRSGFKVAHRQPVRPERGIERQVASARVSHRLELRSSCLVTLGLHSVTWE